MDINQDICKALQMAKAGHWEGGVPVIRANVRLAINSLLARDKDFFEKNEEEILQILKLPRNKGIRKILKKTSTETFAFAVYTALN